MKTKKSLCLMMLFIFSILCTIYVNAASTSVKIFYRGELLTLSSRPVTEGGVVLVPMKSILDSFDTVYDFNNKTKTISVSKGSVNLKLTQGSTTASINGRNVKLPAAPKLVDKQLFLPLEFICKAFDFNFEWNKAANTINITANAPEQKGNTSGNLSNSGYAVSGGDYSFVSFYNTGLLKLKNDDSKKIKLLDQSVNFLNIAGDWIYYVNGYVAKNNESLCMYKIKTDGSSKTKLSSDQISYLNISGEWLFYINESDSNKPYKMRIDGKGLKKISNDSLQSLFVEDGWIYYQKKSDTNIYKMRTSGLDIKKLAADARMYGGNVIKSGEWIYYCSSNGKNSSISKVDVSGKNKKQLVQTKVVSMNIIDGSVFYTDANNCLYKLNENTRTRIKIGYGMGSGLNESNNWLYYSVLTDDYFEIENEYRIKSDGLIKQKFNKDGSFSDVLRISSDEDLPVYVPKNFTSSNLSSGVLTAKDIAKNKAAVVHIKILDDEGNVMATGSGFNIEEGGVIATNFHVISGASSIKCTFDNNTSYEVDYILNYNPLKDIALLHLKDAKDLPVVKLSDSDKVELAEEVLAIGNPMELQNTVSDGIISGIRNFYGINYIQTTASISSGSSGGPLFNSNGNVIGITSMTLMGAQNINFAIPINYVKKLYQSAHFIPMSTINNYDSELLEFEDNNNILSANEFIPNQTITGSIENAKDIDYFKLTLEKDELISFFGTFDSLNQKTAAKAFNITLINQDGTEVAKGSVSTEEGDFEVQKISARLNKGTYYLVVKKIGSDKTNSDLTNYSVLSVID